MMKKDEERLTLGLLRRVVKEQLVALDEQIDHEGIRDVVTGASKMLAAIGDFRKTALLAMTNAVLPHVNGLEKALEDMVSNPGSYVDRQKAKKVVSLRKAT